MKLDLAIHLLFLLFSSFIQAQDKTFSIHFNPNFGVETLSIDKYYTINEVDSIQITSLKFYVSKIEFITKDKIVWEEKNSFHLIDVSKPKSMNISLNFPSTLNFTNIKFYLGIDSLTNVSGAMGGDLDPTLGMYWAWQSGYINFKIEGNSNTCKTRNNEFQFHIGGYQSPFLALQTINIKKVNTEKASIGIDVSKLLNSNDLQTKNHIMSPSKEAIIFAGNIATQITSQ